MRIIILSAALLVSFSTNAAEIRGGRFIEAKNVIELDVIYSGGCKQHSFSLDIGSCMESNPVQCAEVQLVDHTVGDYCEALIRKTIEISLSSAGLDDSYYNGASLTINGDRNSSVNLRLPHK